MVILDTNIIIDHLRRQQREGDSHLLTIAQKVPKEDLTISLITIQELYRGKSVSIVREEERLLEIVSSMKILPYTYEVAQLAGEIARELRRPVELADAAIAATTILNDALLLTLNTEDFAGIKKLQLFDK